MICPSPEELILAFEDSGLRDSDVSPALLAHLDVCSPCRGRAIEIDPTVVFRELPPLAVSEGEVERMRDAVHILVRNRGLVERVSDPHRGVRRAAIGLLAGLALILGPEMRRLDPGMLANGAHSTSGLIATMQMPPPYPSIEDVDPPSARVYQLQDDGLSIVMIVDESLDL